MGEFSVPLAKQILGKKVEEFPFVIGEISAFYMTSVQGFITENKENAVLVFKKSKNSLKRLLKPLNAQVVYSDKSNTLNNLLYRELLQYIAMSLPYKTIHTTDVDLIDDIVYFLKKADNFPFDDDDNKEILPFLYTSLLKIQNKYAVFYPLLRNNDSGIVFSTSLPSFFIELSDLF